MAGNENGYRITERLTPAEKAARLRAAANDALHDEGHKRMSSAEFDYVMHLVGPDEPGDPVDGMMVAEVAVRQREERDTMNEFGLINNGDQADPVDATAPVWWTLVEERVTKRLLPVRERAQAAYGLTSPVPARDLMRFLDAYAPLTSQENLDMPGQRYEGFSVRDGSKIRRQAYLRWGMHNGERFRSQNAVIHDITMKLVEFLGVREEDAVDFLLTDAPLRLPWVDVRAYGSPFGPWFDVRIGSPLVPIEAVYTAIREKYQQLGIDVQPFDADADTVEFLEVFGEVQRRFPGGRGKRGVREARWQALPPHIRNRFGGKDAIQSAHVTFQQTMKRLDKALLSAGWMPSAVEDESIEKGGE